jgi:biotin carboxylase
MELNARLVPGLGMLRGVTHTEFIRAHEDGRYYFLETAGRVGGAFIAELMESSAGVNPWREWARIEVAHMKGEPYHLPPIRHDYAGSVLCLARQTEPDTSAYKDPEIVYRMKKHHHAGVILRSHDPERIRKLLEQYAQSFARDFGASMPVPDRPTA